MIDGSDALMLSGETAAGKYPVESVGMMRRVINVVERWISQQRENNNSCFIIKDGSKSSQLTALAFLTFDGLRPFSFSLSALQDNVTVLSISSPFLTFAGGKQIDMRLSSSLLTSLPHFIFSPNISVVRRVSIYRGCFGVWIDTNELKNSTSKTEIEENRKKLISEIIIMIKNLSLGSVKKGDFIGFIVEDGFPGFSNNSSKCSIFCEMITI
jgi:pyruvate kinase